MKLNKDKVIENYSHLWKIGKTIEIPNTKKSITKTLILNQEQKYLSELFVFFF